MPLDTGLNSLLQAYHNNELNWRVVIDGNGDYRLQYSSAGAQVGNTYWNWDARKFKDEESATLAVGERVVAKVVKHL